MGKQTSERANHPTNWPTTLTMFKWFQHLYLDLKYIILAEDILLDPF